MVKISEREAGDAELVNLLGAWLFPYFGRLPLIYMFARVFQHVNCVANIEDEQITIINRFAHRQFHT